jgi:hypothetical protein
MRRHFVWKLKTRELLLGERTLIMGVLNVTPDSFSDGGKYLDPDRAFARAIELEEQGADIIDIGAESTRPGSGRISAAEEIRRLIPVLKRLRGKLTVPISVDTYKAEVAELAIEHGAEIINDPSGLTFDPMLAKTVVQHDTGLVLNHMRGRPETWAKLPPLRDTMGTIARELEATVSRADATPDLSSWKWRNYNRVEIQNPILGKIPLLRHWTGTGLQPQAQGTEFGNSGATGTARAPGIAAARGTFTQIIPCPAK